MRVPLLRIGLSVGIGLLAIGLTARPSHSADRLYFHYGPVLFPLSLSALETFAQDGRITPEFARYASQFDNQQLAQLRQLLRHRFDMDAVAVYRMTEVPVVDDFLHGLGEVIQTPSGLNGFYAIRAAVTLAAAEQKSWTVLDVMRHFPTDIRIDTASAQHLFNAASSPLHETS